jgi:hypothetical protein
MFHILIMLERFVFERKAGRFKLTLQPMHLQGMFRHNPFVYLAMFGSLKKVLKGL